MIDKIGLVSPILISSEFQRLSFSLHCLCFESVSFSLMRKAAGVPSSYHSNSGPLRMHLLCLAMAGARTHTLLHNKPLPSILLTFIHFAAFPEFVSLTYLKAFSQKRSFCDKTSEISNPRIFLLQVPK